MARLTRFLVSLLLMWGAFPPGARAEEVRLEEIVVRGERVPLSEESLSIQEVRESPARDVGEALDGVRGIGILRKGATANDVVLRGMKRDDLNILIDGVRLYGGCPNRMDPPAFHLDFAEVKSFFLGVQGNFADRQGRVDQSLSETDTDGLAAMDLKAGASYRGLSVHAGTINLLDEQYFSHLSYQRDPFSSGVKVPGNGRNFYLTATYAFGGTG